MPCGISLRKRLHALGLWYTSFVEALATRVGWMASLPRIWWGALLVVIGTSFAAAFGAGAPLIVTVIGAIVFGLVLRFPYAALYAFVGTSLLLGWQVSIPAGQFLFVSDIVRGSIDIQVSEALAAMLLVAWGIRMLTLWRGRRDWHWKPEAPLLFSVVGLVAAHVLSLLSATEPSAAAVIKYAFRPVLLVYLTCVLIPVNFIHARKRLLVVLGVIAVIGAYFAMNGFASLFVFEGGLFTIHRARPLVLGGVNLLGGNHNALAEVLIFAAAAAMAFASLVRVERARAVAYVGAAFMAVVALLTLARSAWLALGIGCVFLMATIWRAYLRSRTDLLVYAAFLLAPFAFLLVQSFFTPGVRGSTDTRQMVNEIAWHVFQQSPWIGVGAGTFLSHVASTYAYTIEFGAPIDAHGVLQKVGAETGIVGLLALLGVVANGFWLFWKQWRRMIVGTPERTAFAYLLAGVIAMSVYQVFDTTYWTARWWLPVGIALAAGQFFFAKQVQRDPDFLTSYDV